MRRTEAMKQARREALIRKLDSMATAAETSGTLPSFDEFVNMNIHPNPNPVKGDEPEKSDDAAEPGSNSGKDNGTPSN